MFLQGNESSKARSGGGNNLGDQASISRLRTEVIKRHQEKRILTEQYPGSRQRTLRGLRRSKPRLGEPESWGGGLH